MLFTRCLIIIALNLMSVCSALAQDLPKISIEAVERTDPARLHFLLVADPPPQTNDLTVNLNISNSRRITRVVSAGQSSQPISIQFSEFSIRSGDVTVEVARSFGNYELGAATKVTVSLPEPAPVVNSLKLTITKDNVNTVVAEAGVTPAFSSPTNVPVTFEFVRAGQAQLIEHGSITFTPGQSTAQSEPLLVADIVERFGIVDGRESVQVRFGTPPPGSNFTLQPVLAIIPQIAPLLIPALVIRKTVDAGAGTFTFAIDGANQPAIPDPTIDTSVSDTFGPIAVSGGSLSIQERDQEGFTLDSATCELDGASLGTFDESSRTVNLMMPEFGRVVCTFNSVANDVSPAEQATIRIRVRSESDTDAFNLSLEGPTTFTGSVTPQTPQTVTVVPGVFTLRQEVADGFRISDITCFLDTTDEITQVDVNQAVDAVEITIANGETVTCVFVNRRQVQASPAPEIIKNFMVRRAEQLTADTGKPRLIERQRGIRTTGNIQEEGDVSYRTNLRGARDGWDIWSEGTISYFDKDGDLPSGRFGLVRVGTDFLISPGVLVGLLAQYDNTRASGDDFKIKGHGFMVGPYAEFELTQGLFFDAKVLWGTSSNHISPLNTYTDQFDTTRWIASARLTGSWHFEAWHLSPRAEIAYYSERSESYIDSDGFDIDAQRVGVGWIKIGPEFSYRHVFEDGTVIEPSSALEGLWSFGDLDDFQLQLSAGLKVKMSNGLSVNVKGFGREGSRGGRLSVTVPLQ